METTEAGLKDLIARNNGRTKLDEKLRERFESFAVLELAPANRPAFELVKAQLKNLEGSQYTRSMLDVLATSSFNRAAAAANRKTTDAEQLAFRCLIQEDFGEALATLGRHEEIVSPPPAPPAPPSRQHLRGSHQDHRRFDASHRERLREARDPQPAIPAQERPAPLPLGGSPGQLTEFVPNHTYPHQDKPVVLAFRHANKATLDRFNNLFHNYNAPYPFAKSSGRIVAGYGDNYLAMCPHYGFEPNGICYLDITVVNHEGDYAQIRANTVEARDTENAKQAALAIMLDARLISPVLAVRAGYDDNSIGALYAKDQITVMRLEADARRRGR